MEKFLLTQNMNVLWASLIIEEMVKNGVDKFFISPGNRNAPIISALAYNGGAQKKIFFDERSAAYLALGHAKATGKPGVIACTSGTALANYFPAVMEAYRDCLPLVVLSSDRPPDLLGSDANQTADQPGIYSGYALEKLNLPCPDPAFPLEALLAKIDHILQVRTGPVHINCQFRDPLVPREDPRGSIPEKLLRRAEALFLKDTPQTRYYRMNHETVIPAEAMDSLKDTARGLLIIGRLHPFQRRENIQDLMKNLPWPVFCDIGSSLKHAAPRDRRIFDLDHAEALKLILDYSPDTILHLGSGLVSKQFYDVLLAKLPSRYIMVNAGQELRDPAHRITMKITMDPDDFAASLQQAGSMKSGGMDTPEIREAMERLEKKTASLVPREELTFPAVAEAVALGIGSGHGLFLGNSITVREFDRALFRDKEVAVVVNRGVSGIEGNISTALGFAEGSRRHTTSVIGDLSLLHDLNGLAGLIMSPVPVVVIIVNNHGGRIFERLPIRDFPHILEPFITAPHTLNFGPAAELFGIPYALASTPEELARCYEIALQKKTAYIIEAAVSGPRDLDIHTRIKNASAD